MRARGGWAAILSMWAIVAGPAPGGLVGPLASPAIAAECTAESAVPDFDGAGDVRPDLPIGVPGEDVGTAADAGLVEIRYATPSRSGQALTAPTPLAGDRFGSALLAEDLDDDLCTDLLVGAPGHDVGSAADAGAVFAFRGTPTGLQFWTTLTMGTGGLPGPAQSGAMFGSVLDGNATWKGQLLAGLPRYDVGGATDAGAVMEFTLFSGGRLYTQNSPGVAGGAEAGDQFGAAVQGDFFAGPDRRFFAGVPGEDLGSATDAGAVLDCAGSTVGAVTCPMLTQDTPGVTGVVESGDRFGAALALGSGLVIGVPGEAIGTLSNAGAVNVWFDPRTPGIGASQDTEGIPGTAEAGDGFGASLAVAPIADQRDLVQIGVPGEAVGTLADAGVTNTVELDASGQLDPVIRGLTGLSAANTAATAEAGDGFGASVEAYAITDPEQPLWVVGSPGDSSGAGEVVVATTGPTGTAPPSSEALTQAPGTPEPGDAYGAAVKSVG